VEEEVDLREYLQVLLKWKWLILAVVIIAVATSAVLSWYILPSVYEAKTAILVAAGDQKTTVTTSQDLQELVDSVSRLPQMTINTYVSQVKNPELLNQVITTLKLDPNVYRASALAAMISAKAIPDTNLIEISVQNTDPVLAANLANAVREQFLQQISDTNQKKLANSVALLEKEAQTTKAELEAVTKKLEELDAQSRNVQYLDGQQQSLLAQINDYRIQKVEAEVLISQLRAGYDRLKQQLEATEPNITRVETTPVETTPDTAVATTVTEPNPAYLKLQESLDAQEVQLAESEARLAAVSAALSTLDAELGKVQKEAAASKVERQTLEEQQGRLKEAYNVLAQKITETRIASSISVGETTLLTSAQAAVPSSPIKPNRPLNVAVALVLGLMLGALVAFLMEYLDNTFKSAEALEEKLGLPILGRIPEHKQKQKPVTERPLPAPGAAAFAEAAAGQAAQPQEETR